VIGGVSKTWAIDRMADRLLRRAPDLAEGIERLQSQSTSNPSSVSQHAALRAFTGPRTRCGSMRECFSRRRDFVVKRLSAMKAVRLVPPEGAFYAFPDVSERIAKARNGVRDRRVSAIT